jgi:hypothetical protein
MDQSRSDIYGTGYGSSHTWKRGETRQLPYDADYRLKATSYTCTACNTIFYHYYDTTPDIFAAIKQAGIADTC